MLKTVIINREEIEKSYPIQKQYANIYAFDNFIQGDGNIWAKSKLLSRLGRSWTNL